MTSTPIWGLGVCYFECSSHSPCCMYETHLSFIFMFRLRCALWLYRRVQFDAKPVGVHVQLQGLDWEQQYLWTSQITRRYVWRGFSEGTNDVRVGAVSRSMFTGCFGRSFCHEQLCLGRINQNHFSHLSQLLFPTEAPRHGTLSPRRRRRYRWWPIELEGRADSQPR